ncbi:AraC family transcriptional regulator [Pedobacter frigoris]|uniref:AraC family transcriptional regulator n=1 Tax=Pedobacter frigoris TaxID=2571272 RepID=UPI00292DE8E4|nr:AraC family transcriptional regulator [Pedobacter frigoris]
MKRFNNFHSINVFSLELVKWEYELHKHNFYELIFIEEGAGSHLLNEMDYTYKKGDVFLLTPDDAHEFVIEEKTVFTYVKFTEQVFLEKLSTKKRSQWEEALKNILASNQINQGNIICDPQDNAHVFAILKVLLYEFQNKLPFKSEAVLELFGSLMVLITRNLNTNRPIDLGGIDKETEKLNNILAYARIHAFDQEKSLIPYIAAHFLMSPNYISIYVKKHTGLSLQQQIIHFKLKTAEKLLKQKRLNINEIAERLGFTDASHFNKTFKKYLGKNPSAF